MSTKIWQTFPYSLGPSSCFEMNLAKYCEESQDEADYKLENSTYDIVKKCEHCMAPWTFVLYDRGSTQKSFNQLR